MYYLLDNNQLEDSNNHSNKVQDNIFQYKHQNQKLELKKNSKLQRKITLPMSFNSDPTIHITELRSVRFGENANRSQRQIFFSMHLLAFYKL